MSKEKLKNKGITLIALIITIIVMLILTGVTLSITLGDNGLVNKAKEASEEMQVAMDRELLLSAAIGAMGNDGKVNLSAMILPEGFTGSNGTYTSKNGNIFTVSENGEIAVAGSGNIGGDIVEDGNGELEFITNPWIERGLSADWEYGKWYAYEEEGLTFFYLGEDGSYKQGEDIPFNTGFEFTSEQFDEQTAGIGVFNGNEFTLTDIWSVILNDDGTATLTTYDDGENTYTLITVNENDYEYNLDGIYLSSDGTNRFVFSSEDKCVSMQYLSGDSWMDSSSYYKSPYWNFKGIYYIGGKNDIDVSEDLNTITYNNTTYTKQAN